MKLVDDYIQSKEFMGLAPSTRLNYRKALAAFLAYHKTTDTQTNLKKILDGFVKAKEKEVSGQTIQHYITVIKLMFKWNGYGIKYTYRLPAKERVKNRKKNLNRWFTEEEVNLCLDYPFDAVRDKLIVRLLIETGARLAEIASIHSTDVHVEDRYIMIMKSKTAERPIFFSPDTAELFQHLDPNDILGEPVKLFPGADQIRNIVNGMLEDMGMKNGKDGRGPHTFRHWAATNMYYNGGMNLMDIAFILGDKPETIQNTYLHPTPLMLRNRLDSALNW